MAEKKEMKETESDKIWDEVKDLPIDMFSLPNQIVSMHVRRVKALPDALYLKLNSSATIVGLENSLALVRGKKYAVELNEGYVVVRRAFSGIPSAPSE